MNEKALRFFNSLKVEGSFYGNLYQALKNINSFYTDLEKKILLSKYEYNSYLKYSFKENFLSPFHVSDRLNCVNLTLHQKKK